MIKAVVFDLDDTLYPERDYVLSGARAAAIYAAGGDGDREKEYVRAAEEIAQSPFGVIDGFCEKFPDGGFDKAELLNVYRNHAPEIEPYADALPCLDALRERGIKLALLTDGRPTGQRNKITALGIADKFDKILITDELDEDLHYRKPDRLAYGMLCAELGVKPEETAVVGDNPKKDFLIGQSGYVTVRVMRDGLYKDEDYCEGVKERYTVDSLDGLCGVIDEIDGAERQAAAKVKAFIHDKLLELMDFVHGVCVSEGIEYSLSGGTMLGAVRHKGFIPWDDDMDIIMKREEYRRFAQVINSYCDKSDGFVFTADNRVSTVSFARPPKSDGKIFKGIRVDIFILDALPEREKERKRLIFGLKKLQGMLHKDKIDWKHYSIKGRILLFGTKVLGMFRSKKKLVEAYHKLASKYDGGDFSQYFVSNDLFAVLGLAYEKSLFDGASETAFEDRRYFVFDGYDAILTERYGDYMTPPPEEQRVSNHTDIAVEEE